MKLHLASFIEPENFGPGRVIGIANGKKPDHVRCEAVFPPFVPSNEIHDSYYETKVKDPKKAAKVFIDKFSQQLEKFADELELKAEEQGCHVQDLLPFQDGDTLASWERESRNNYRDLIEKVLERLGYEVERH